jgi:hypothetical protein
MIKKSILVLSILTCGMAGQAQKLGKFGADLGKKSVLGKDVRVPYTDVSTYYGYVAPGSKPDEVKNGKNFYYVYLWIPAVAPEIGIRMVSPVPEGMSPEATDFKSATYDANKADTKNYFDTWISLERAINITSLADIKNNLPKATWTSYGNNDDSKELPAQPSGNNYNSLLRITSDAGNPLKALTIGLYRIGFTTYKTGDVQGSFVAQIGAPVKMPGVVVAATAEELEKVQ